MAEEVKLGTHSGYSLWVSLEGPYQLSYYMSIGVMSKSPSVFSQIDRTCRKRRIWSEGNEQTMTSKYDDIIPINSAFDNRTSSGKRRHCNMLSTITGISLVSFSVKSTMHRPVQVHKE